MNKIEEKYILNFIKNLLQDNYAEASKNLQDIVTEKIKQRIKKAMSEE